VNNGLCNKTKTIQALSDAVQNQENKMAARIKKSAMKKKAVKDGNYGDNVSNTQNIYFDKKGYKNITDTWNTNQNLITPSQKYPPKTNPY